MAAKVTNPKRFDPVWKKWYNRHYKRRAILQRKLWAIAYKGSCCVDCGINLVERPECADFDHLRDKEFAISKEHTRRWAVIVAELDKTELVCANCHRTRTWQRSQARINAETDLKPTIDYGRRQVVH